MKKRFLLILSGLSVCCTLFGMRDSNGNYRIREVSVSFLLSRYPDAEFVRSNTSGAVAKIAERNLQGLKNAYNLERSLCGNKYFSLFRYNLDLLSNLLEGNFFYNRWYGLQLAFSAYCANKRCENKAVESELRGLIEDFYFLLSHGVSRECYPDFVTVLLDAGVILFKSVGASSFRRFLDEYSDWDTKKKHCSVENPESFQKLSNMIAGVCGQNDISDLWERLEVLEKKFAEDLNVDAYISFEWRFSKDRWLFGCLFSKPSVVLFPYPEEKIKCVKALSTSHDHCVSKGSRCGTPVVSSSLIQQAEDLSMLGYSSSCRTQQQSKRTFCRELQQRSGRIASTVVIVDANRHGKGKLQKVKTGRAHRSEKVRNGPPYRFKFPKANRVSDDIFLNTSSSFDDSRKKEAVLSPFFGVVDEKRPHRYGKDLENNTSSHDFQLDEGKVSSSRKISVEEEENRSQLLFPDENNQRVSRERTGAHLEFSSCQQVANIDRVWSPLELSRPICSVDLCENEEEKNPLSISLQSYVTEVEREDVPLEVQSFDSVSHTDGNAGRLHLEIDPNVCAIEANWAPHLDFASQSPVLVKGKRPSLQLGTSVSELNLDEKKLPVLEIDFHSHAAEVGEMPMSLRLETLDTVFDVNPGSSQLTPIQAAAKSMLDNSFGRLRMMYKFLEAYGNSVVDGVLSGVRQQFSSLGFDNSLLDGLISFVQSKDASRNSFLSDPMDFSYLMKVASDFDNAVTIGFMGVLNQLSSKSSGSVKMALGGGCFPRGDIRFKGVDSADYFEGTVIFEEGRSVFDLKMKFDIGEYWHDVSLRLNENTLYFEHVNFKTPFSPSEVFCFQCKNVYHVPRTKILYVFGIANPGLEDQAYCCVLSKNYLFFGDVKRKAGEYLLDRDRVNVMALIPKVEVIRGCLARADGSKYVEEKKEGEEKEKLPALIDRLLKASITKEDEEFISLIERREESAKSHGSSDSDLPGSPLPFLKSARISSTPPSSQRGKELTPSQKGKKPRINMDSMCEKVTGKKIDFEEEEEDLDGDDFSKNRKEDGSNGNS